MNPHEGILLIGGGGHACSVIEALVARAGVCRGQYEKIAIIEMPVKVGTYLFGVPVAGTDADLADLRSEYGHAVISLGSSGDCTKRKALFRLASPLGYNFPLIAHPTSYLSELSTYGFGVFAGIKSIVNADCVIRDMCIINTGCIVEHGCDVGAYVHIAPGAALCGGVKIGDGSHIGAGSVVLQRLAIGRDVTIGAGSVVTRDIPDGVVAFGNPCRVVRQK